MSAYRSCLHTTNALPRTPTAAPSARPASGRTARIHCHILSVPYAQIWGRLPVTHVVFKPSATGAENLNEARSHKPEVRSHERENPNPEPRQPKEFRNPNAEIERQQQLSCEPFAGLKTTDAHRFAQIRTAERFLSRSEERRVGKECRDRWSR